MALYRGDFLAQFAPRDSVVFSEWALVMRERLHHQALGALARLLAYHEQHGADEAAQRYAQLLLALEPWDEAAHRCLMRVFARSGQRTAGLAQYERCRQVLADELGIEPSTETTALCEDIRVEPLEAAVGGQVARRAPMPIPVRRTTKTNLPMPPSPLIGRAQDTEVLARLFQLSDAIFMSIFAMAIYARLSSWLHIGYMWLIGTGFTFARSSQPAERQRILDLTNSTIPDRSDG